MNKIHPEVLKPLIVIDCGDYYWDDNFPGFDIMQINKGELPEKSFQSFHCLQGTFPCLFDLFGKFFLRCFIRLQFLPVILPTLE